MESILTSIKKLLGITDEYDQFDQNIIIFINTALATLTQLGVGPSSGFSISGKDDKWSDFIGEDPRLNSIQSYIYYQVKLSFDSSTLSGPMIESINRELTKLEWRINVTAETPIEEE